jgi:hypothetical protein
MAMRLKNTLDRVNEFLDRYVLPWPVRFLTFRFVILITIGLLIPLIVFASRTSFVLAINSYLNTMSVAVSSIVLLYAMVSEARQKQIAEMQEKRAQEDHLHVTEMHNLIMQTLQNQNDELAQLKRLLATLSGKEFTPSEPPELHDTKMLHHAMSLHPRGEKRFADSDLDQRLQANVHDNALVSTIRKGFPSPAEDD